MRCRARGQFAALVLAEVAQQAFGQGVRAAVLLPDLVASGGRQFASRSRLSS